MRRQPLQAVGLLGFAAILAATGLVNCATSEAVIARERGDASATPLGPAPDAAGSDGGDAVVNTLMCVATTCPEPYLTCPSDDGPTYACAVDPRRDSNHCGGCNQVCPTFESLHMRSRCADGQCVLECVSVPRPDGPGEALTAYRDCNRVDDDGCETDVLLDEDNCGTCGNVCPPGVRCIGGQCGCPKGLQACGESCVDVQSNDSNCARCGTWCPQPDVACELMPPATSYGCMGGDCGRLKCRGGFADCDRDLDLGCESNGCEVYVNDDHENCGACGMACKPDEVCRSTPSGAACFPSCDKSNLKTCAGDCADTLNDPDNCGGCGLSCSFGGPSTQRVCQKGICAVRCSEGFGDCNGDPLDGCETNLLVHPAHCGACGKTCDLAAGQPCVEGQCLEQPCKPSEAR